MGWVRILAFAIVIVITTGAQAAEPAPATRAILVLDASGSMWGQVDGKHKVEIARTVVADLVRSLDPNVHLGLSAYGHRRKGDCSDIEQLIPVGPVDTERTITAVNRIKPKGKTPLSEAVRQAAEVLRYTEEAATVILVSDGKETCNVDPCALGKTLEESGVRFTVHVIGFGIKEEERAGLQCLAENTGGRFLSAGDADTLASALQTVVGETVAMTGPNTEVVALLAEGGPEVERFFQWTVHGAEDESGTPARKAIGSRLLTNLDTGRYRIAGAYKGVAGSITTDIDARKRNEHAVVLNAGLIRFTALEAEDREYGGKEYVWWSVFPIDDTGTASTRHVRKEEGVTEEFLLSAGRYRVRGEAGTVRVETDIAVTAGEVRDIDVMLASGTVTLTALETEGREYQGQDYVWWSVYPMEADGTPARKHIEKDEGVTENFTLSPGPYRIVAEAGTIRAETDIVIEGGKTIAVPVLLASGTVSLTALEAEGREYQGQDYVWWSLYPMEANGSPARKHIEKDDGVTESFTLSPGPYRVVAEAGTIRAETDIVIEGGKTIAVPVLLASGTVTLTALEAEGREYQGQDYVWWSVYPMEADGSPARKHVEKDDGVTHSFTLSPGPYRVVAEAGTVQAETDITIEGGKTIAAPVLLASGTVTLTAQEAEGRKYQGQDYVWWSVYPMEADGSPARKHVEKDDGVTHSFTVSPGPYRVVAEAGSVRAETDITIEAGKRIAVPVLLASGTVTLTAQEVEGRKYQGQDYVWWSVYPMEADGSPARKHVEKDDGVTHSFTVSPGPYRVVAEAGSVRAETDITIEAGKRIAVPVLLASGTVALTALETEGKTYNGDEYVWWSVYPIGTDGAPANRYVEKDHGVTEKFTLPPGRYLATVEAGELASRAEFEISAGKTVTLPVVLAPKP